MSHTTFPPKPHHSLYKDDLEALLGLLQQIALTYFELMANSKPYGQKINQVDITTNTLQGFQYYARPYL